MAETFDINDDGTLPTIGPGVTKQVRPDIAAALLGDGGGGGGASITVSDTDPGAVGADSVWVQTAVGGNDEYTQIWVRNEADDGWLVISPVTNGDGETYTLITSPNDVAELNLTDDTGSYLSANTNLAIRVGLKGIFINGATGVHFGFSSDGPAVIVGTADPSQGGGVESPLGSIYLRVTGGVGSMYQKTGAGDTAWSLGFGNTSLAAYNAAANIFLASALAGSITLFANSGAIMFPGLPTSDPVNTGQLWNDGGTLKVSAG